MLTSALNLFYLLETQEILWRLPGGNGLSMIFLELIVCKSNSPTLVFQLLAVPILSTFLALILLPPRVLGIVFSCLVIVVCGHF